MYLETNITNGGLREGARTVNKKKEKVMTLKELMAAFDKIEDKDLQLKMYSQLARNLTRKQRK